MDQFGIACGGRGKRTCKLNNAYDFYKGSFPADEPGPSVFVKASSASGNTFFPKSGVFKEDYYFSYSCTKDKEENLDEHNGHSHDGFGYHYHM